MRIFKLGDLYALLLVIVTCVVISSCSAPKNITYFRDVPDTIKKQMVDLVAYNTPAIQPDDILQVTIQTLDPTANAMLNQQNTASWPIGGSSSTNAAAVPQSSNTVSGYVVDKDGYVVLPLLGKVMVKGKTTDVVRDEIRTKALEYYKDPVVNVRFANFKVTVLGEVTRPSTYIMPSEKVTLLDAIGMAGDLTIYGKRTNVLLVRDGLNGKKEFVRFNLADSKIFSSPYFYLRQGDVIYVEPNKQKIAGTDMAQVRTISILASVLTVIIVIVSRVNL